jgi:uncharacterized protein YhfF
MTYLPSGCAPPDPAELDAYWRRAKTELTVTTLPDTYQVRWIGLDDDTTREVLELIRSGDKTGTYTLPWLIELTEQPEPAVGDAIILLNFAGQPRLLVRLTAIETVSFGKITRAHTAIDGSPVRDLAIWKPLHTHYWNSFLAPFQQCVTDAMPVLVEKFELLHAAATQAD